MANCGRCFRPKPDLKPYRETVTDEICKSCTYDLEAVVGFLEYHGWTILPPGEIVEIAKAVEDRIIREGMQTEYVYRGGSNEAITPQPPNGDGTEPDFKDPEWSDPPPIKSIPQEKQRKGRQRP